MSRTALDVGKTLAVTAPQADDALKKRNLGNNMYQVPDSNAHGLQKAPQNINYIFSLPGMSLY
jgi:hypothetical protein